MKLKKIKNCLFYSKIQPRVLERQLDEENIVWYCVVCMKEAGLDALSHPQAQQFCHNSKRDLKTHISQHHSEPHPDEGITLQLAAYTTARCLCASAKAAHRFIGLGKLSSPLVSLILP